MYVRALSSRKIRIVRESRALQYTRKPCVHEVQTRAFLHTKCSVESEAQALRIFRGGAVVLVSRMCRRQYVLLHKIEGFANLCFDCSQHSGNGLLPEQIALGKRIFKKWDEIFTA